MYLIYTCLLWFHAIFAKTDLLVLFLVIENSMYFYLYSYDSIGSPVIHCMHLAQLLHIVEWIDTHWSINILYVIDSVFDIIFNQYLNALSLQRTSIESLPNSPQNRQVLTPNRLLQNPSWKFSKTSVLYTTNISEPLSKISSTILSNNISFVLISNISLEKTVY